MTRGRENTMRRIMKAFSLAATGSALMLGLATAQAQAPLKMTLFGQPSVNNDSIWMAFEKGFYKDEGLDVTYRLFPSGTTAFQSFQTGQGDIVMTGDLPSLQYFFRVKGDYRTIAAIERDAKGYVAVAGKDIKTPQDLAGKTIATAAVPALKAPTDLIPKTAVVTLTLPAHAEFSGGSATIESTGAVPEITQMNNRVQF